MVLMLQSACASQQLRVELQLQHKPLCVKAAVCTYEPEYSVGVCSYGVVGASTKARCISWFTASVCAPHDSLAKLTAVQPNAQQASHKLSQRLAQTS